MRGQGAHKWQLSSWHCRLPGSGCQADGCLAGVATSYFTSRIAWGFKATWHRFPAFVWPFEPQGLPRVCEGMLPCQVSLAL